MANLVFVRPYNILIFNNCLTDKYKTCTVEKVNIFTKGPDTYFTAFIL